MSNQQTNTNLFFFLLFTSFTFTKRSTMATGHPKPGYQSNSVRYVAPPSRFQQLQGQVDEVTNVMKDNIKLELERGAKLDDLENKSDMLNNSSQQFALHSKQIRRKYWWKNVKMWIILIIIIVIILTIIIVASVLASKKKV